MNVERQRNTVAQLQLARLFEPLRQQIEIIPINDDDIGQLARLVRTGAIANRTRPVHGVSPKGFSLANIYLF